MISSKTKRRIGYWLFLILFTLVACEILLRIFNPFPSSVVGDKIILTPNYSKIYKNTTGAADMDETIIYKRNSIGLRGPEPPVAFKDHLSIIAIGGSTTECMFISEGKTWEDQLYKNLSGSFPKLWVNNGGFAGHSSFGHIILLRDYIINLKPTICLFLVGGNDIDRKDLNPHDENFTKTNDKWILSLAKKSALANTLLNLYRNHLAKEKSLADGKPFSLLNKKPFVIPDFVIQEKIRLQEPLVKAFASRLKEMIRLCKLNGIEPIFITQPCLAGESIDSVTGVDLASFPMSDKINGKLFWKYMQLYNAETIKVSKEEGLCCIDLANELPKSSAYYYDLIHYNISGNARVAKILSEKLDPYLHTKYPGFYRNIFIKSGHYQEKYPMSSKAIQNLGCREFFHCSAPLRAFVETLHTGTLRKPQKY